MADIGLNIEFMNHLTSNEHIQISNTVFIYIVQCIGESVTKVFIVCYMWHNYIKYISI